MCQCDYDEWPPEDRSRVQLRQNFNNSFQVSATRPLAVVPQSKELPARRQWQIWPPRKLEARTWQTSYGSIERSTTQTTKSHQITMHTHKLLKLLLGHSRAKWLLSEGRSCSWSNRQVPSRTKWAPVWNLFVQFWTCFCTASINASTCFKFQHGLSLRLEIKCV